MASLPASDPDPIQPRTCLEKKKGDLAPNAEPELARNAFRRIHSQSGAGGGLIVPQRRLDKAAIGRMERPKSHFQSVEDLRRVSGIGPKLLPIGLIDVDWAFKAFLFLRELCGGLLRRGPRQSAWTTAVEKPSRISAYSRPNLSFFEHTF
jgi:hypothetical protein